MDLFVVNAAIAQPILAAMPMPLSKSEQLIEEIGLNPMLLDEADGVLPLHAAEELVYRTHEKSGDPCWSFGVLSAAANADTGAIANIPLPRQTVALDGVRSFVKTIDGFLTGTFFFVEVDETTLWIKRTSSTTDWSDSWALIFYNFTVFLAGIRAILGSDVHPCAACVAAKDVPPQLPPELKGIPIATNSAFTALGFDKDVLTRAVQKRDVAKPNSTKFRPQVGVFDHSDLVNCLSKLLASYSTDRLADRAARTFGVSRRSYQRQLTKLGVTHRELAANARLTLALELLDDCSWSITQISYELGYRHPGDFTRFFRARTGLSPNAHRRAAGNAKS